MRRFSIVAACAVAGMLASAAAAPAGGPQHASGGPRLTSHELQEARQATTQYRDVRRAERAGYELAGGCVAGPTGAMGFHYANPALAGDRELDTRRPEILVYEQRHGRMHLVAVEYFRADADGRLDTDDDRPSLFDRGFDGPMEGHDPGMPVHYDLHAWLFKRNPDGVFAQYNPRVSC
jgi:hypothetical protein